MMKKKNLLVTILTVASLTTSMIAPSFAAAVQGSYYNSGAQYTDVTNTIGYAVGNFTGNYYPDGSRPNNAIIRGDADGAAKDLFTTKLEMRITDRWGIELDGTYKTSDDEGETRNLTYTINVNSDDMKDGGRGYVEASCVSKSNSSDKWEINYLYDWEGAKEGWS